MLIYGARASDNLGFVAKAGDINGDGIVDLEIGGNVARSSSGVRFSGMVVTLYGQCNFTKVLLAKRKSNSHLVTYLFDGRTYGM